MPPLPRNLSTFPVSFKTIYTQTMLSTKAIMIFTLAYSARSDNNVVNAPAPANRGNTRGTSVASLIGPVFLNISTSRIISSAMKNIMSAPAIANDSMSTRKRLNNK